MASEVRSKARNGVTYVYSNVSYWDEKEKKTKHKRKCIGHVDPKTGKTVPNRKRKTGNEHPKAESVGIPTFVSVEVFGPVSILTKAAENLQLSDLLKEVFPWNYPVLLTCTFYLASENGPLRYVNSWCERYSSPCAPEEVSPDEIRELLPRLTADLRNEFFRKWTALHSESGSVTYAYTFPVFASFREQFSLLSDEADQDPNPVSLPLALPTLLIAGENPALPLYLQVLEGETFDMAAIDREVKTLPLSGSSTVYVLDQSFFRPEEINALFERQENFCVRVPADSRMAEELILTYRDSVLSPASVISMDKDSPEDSLYAGVFEERWNNHPCFLHLCFDGARAAKDQKDPSNFGKLSEKYRGEAPKGNLKRGHEDQYEQYFAHKDTPKQEPYVSLKGESSQEAHFTNDGWSLMLSSHVKDAAKGIRLYQDSRQAQAYFSDFDSEPDREKLGTHVRRSSQGQMFLQFLGLAIRAEILRVMREHEEFKDFTVPELIAETKTIARRIPLVLLFSPLPHPLKPVQNCWIHTEFL